MSKGRFNKSLPPFIRVQVFSHKKTFVGCHKNANKMKFIKSTASFLALAFGSASAFTGFSSSFVPRSQTYVQSSSSLQMVADDAKVILVTGASRGLGRSIACELGAHGQKVIVNYAGSEDAANETVEMVKAAGGDAIAIQANCKY